MESETNNENLNNVDYAEKFIETIRQCLPESKWINSKSNRRLIQKFIGGGVNLSSSVLLVSDGPGGNGSVVVRLVDDWKSIDKTQLGSTVLFVRCDTQTVNQDTNVEIRWVTDDEAVKHLSHVLKSCSISNQDILTTYHQLERFVDRENVLKSLTEERRIFLMKINNWSENLLEFPDSSSPSSDNDESNTNNELSPESNEVELNSIAHELNSLSRKVFTFKSNQKLLKQILSNLFVLFSGVSGLVDCKSNLTMTAKMLCEEADQLYSQWCSKVSANIHYDLNRQCVVIDEQTHRPIITFSIQLEKFAKDAQQFREFGYKITSDIEQIEQHVSVYVSFVRDLRKIVLFYMTVADKILLCQRAMMIAKAKAFTTLLESKQKLTWNDGVDAIGAWIDELKVFMKAFVDENDKLKNLHCQVLEMVKWMVEVSFNDWARLIEKIRVVMEEVDQKYQNTLTWRKHWDYQVYKILEYYFNCLMVDTSATRATILTDTINFSKSDFELQQQKLWIEQGNQMDTGSLKGTTGVELQFNPSGLIVFVPPIESIKQTLFEQLQSFVQFPSTFSAFIDWSKDRSLNPDQPNGKQQAKRTLYHNIYYRNANKFPLLYGNVFLAIEELIQIREQFRKWCSLYNMIKLIKSNDYLQKDELANGKTSSFQCRTMEDYRHNLQLIKRLATKFAGKYSMINDIKCRCSNFVVNIIPIKMFVEWLLSESEAVLLKLFKTECENEIVHIEAVCKNVTDLMSKKAETIDELIHLERFVHNQLESEHSNVMIDNVTLREKVHFLKTWPSSSPVTNRDLPKLDDIVLVIKEFENYYKQSKQILLNNRELLQSKLSSERANIEAEIDDFLNRWNKLTDELKRMPEIINDFQVNSNQLMSTVNEQRKSFDYFQMNIPPSFDQMEQVANTIKEFYQEFHVLYEFEQGLSHYLEMEWIVCRNKLAKINEYVTEWIDQHPTMDQALLTHVHNWKQFLALLELCRGDFYQQLHWKQFLALIDSDKNFEELKLNELLVKRVLLNDNRSAILELNKRAFNDYTLREALNELNQFALNSKLTLYPYNTRENRQVMLIKDWAQCLNQISDSFLLIQTVKNIDSNDISEEYLQEYQDWEVKLVKLESLVTLLNAVQRKWISLEPIYCANQAGGNATIFSDQMFVRFSSDFQTLMQTIQQNDCKLIYLNQVNNLESRLQKIDQNFSSTQKKLRNFIEESRQRFPRFYFLADEDLLLILSGKVDLNQSALVKKLFVNTIGRLVYSTEQNKLIVSFESIQGELIRLKMPIKTENSSGPLGIENWLKELDTEIKSTLKAIFGEYLPNIRSIYDDINIFSNLPCQLLSLFCWIDFTEKIEDSISKHSLNDLKFDYGRKLSSLTKMNFVQLVCDALCVKNSNGQSNVNHLCKMKVKQTVLDVIHFINVIDLLVDNGVSNSTDWWWRSQLRFYTKQVSNTAEVVIQMGLATFAYSFEYLGCLGDGKLVHTNLTNKCYLTLTQAMDLGLGGNPYGPAGTGKTESVKALGHHFGRQVLVFNCDEAIDVKSMTRILVGLVKCGSWGCFDEFNRLQLNVLSILSSQIQSIQHSIKINDKFVYLAEYGQVSINTNAAIFITLNPAGKDYGGRNRIPDNLKSLFLPVSMTVPDNRVIVRFLLLAEGFNDSVAQMLGEKVTLWFELASGSMSRQKHYDWGLRAMKACLEASGKRLQMAGDGQTGQLDDLKQINIVMDTFRQQIKSKLVDDDVPKFDGLMEAVFGKSIGPMSTENDEEIVNQFISDKLDKAIRKVIAEYSLLENEYQLEKIYQLYEIIQTRFGVVLIGPSGSGKTTAWKILRRALEMAHLDDDLSGKALVNITVINPKALERSKLFGFIDEDTREWHDGLFSKQSRQIARDYMEGSIHWIIFDGDIDPDWVEALNSVLDDNRVLTLPSGERIDFDLNKCRILFETTSLKFASPATISRLGVVCIDSTIVDEIVQCYVAKNQLSLSMLSTASSFLQSQTSNSKSMQISITHTLMEHLRFCQINQEDETLAIQRLEGQILYGNEDRLETDMVNNLVVTESVAKLIELVKPLTTEHLCLVGPVGSGKSMLASELIFVTNGQLVNINCTPSSNAAQLIKALLDSCTTILTGANRTLRPTSGEHLWIFIKHFEILTYDKWLSNSLVSLIVMLLKHQGFYHPDTFEWIQLEKFQIVITCNDRKIVDERLLTTMHVIHVTRASLFEIEQILYAKAKLIDSSLCELFPSKFVEMVRLIEHVLNESGEYLDDELNYLQIAIDILSTVKHYEVISEPIIMFEMCRGLRNHFPIDWNAQLDQLFEQEFALEQGMPGTIYTSLNGSKLFNSIEIDLFCQHLLKLTKSYHAENDLQWNEWELLPQTVNIAVQLCSFLSDDTVRANSILFMVGPCGVGRKCLAKAVAHHFGYDRVWTPNSILSERHLTNELKSLLEDSGDSTSTSTSTNSQKLLLLVDEIHFRILPYLRDQLYSLLCSEIQTTNQLKLIITTSEVSKLDRLLWIRKAHLHRVAPFTVSCYERWTGKLLSNNGINSNGFTEHHVTLLYEIYEHFGKEIHSDFSERQLENIHYYTGYVRSFLELYGNQLAVLGTESERLRLGVTKLNQVSTQVSTLKNDAFEQKQLLDAKRLEADEAFNLIMNSMHESEDKKGELEEIQKRIEVETVTLNERKSKIYTELEQIEPVLKAAKAAIGGIRSDALAEIRSLRAPPEVIRDILEGVLRLMGVNDTSWISMKTFLSKRGVKEDIMNFDCHKITPEIRSKVEKLLVNRSESFQTTVAKRASAAAAPLAEWVKANVQYSKVLHEIEPLEQELKTLESGMVRAQSKLKTLNLQLKGVDTEVDALRARMQAVTVEAAQIELNLRNTSQVLDQSEALVSDLSGEYQRWTSKLDQIQSELALLVERCIVASAYMVFVGCEPSSNRRQQLLSQCFDKFNVPHFDLNQFVGVSGEEELFFSVPSGGIVPLICDPAHKALKYITNHEYTRLKASDWLRVLELSIRFGRTLVIDDFNQLDIGLISLIFSNIYGNKETRFWTYIGDRKVDYNANFRLYLLTENLSTLKQLPLWLFRVVNLSPSFGSISSQLLGHIIHCKRPELEQDKDKVEHTVRTLQQQLSQLEGELLENLTNESGNILDNVKLIEKLKFLKSSSFKVEKSLQESDQLRRDLDSEREQYDSIAQFAASLFFSVENLPKLNPMYYFGYEEFETLFKRVLRTNASTFDNDTLCYTFYCHVSQALFAEHRRTLRHYILSRFPDTSSRISSTNVEASRTIGELIVDTHNRIEANQCEILLILTTPGADPTTEINNTVTRLGYDLKMVSMGNDVVGQVTTLLQPHWQPAGGNKAKQALCLCNLHLIISWLPQLCLLLQHLRKDSKTTSPLQLILLISETSDMFPTNLLEMCTKFAYESMPGVRANLRRLKATVESMQDMESVKSSPNKDILTNLLSIHVIFHVICYERRYYIPFGWTKNYEISFNEFCFGRNVIRNLFQLDQANKLAKDRKQLCQYIYGLFCDVIYGGKVDFDVDQMVLSLLMKRYFDSNVAIASATDLKRQLFGDNEGEMSEFALLTLPLNINTFRNQTNEQKLQNNLQLLHTKMTEQNLTEDRSGKSKPTLQPSGVNYFRKLWKKILVKCKVVEPIEVDEDAQLNTEVDSWNQLIEQFIQLEINFAKRLMLIVDGDLKGDATRQTEGGTDGGRRTRTNNRLLTNQTPDDWQSVWANGTDVAQDFLVKLARVYIRLTGQITQTKSKQIIFDLTACFHPKFLLNTLSQFAAKRFEICVDELSINSKWITEDDDGNEWSSIGTSGGNNRTIQAYLDGVWIEGALFESGRLQDCFVDSPFTSKMPLLCLTVGSKEQMDQKRKPSHRLSSVQLPLYSNTERTHILQYLSAPCTSGDESRWLQMGAAFVLGNFTPNRTEQQ